MKQIICITGIAYLAAGFFEYAINRLAHLSGNRLHARHHQGLSERAGGDLATVVIIATAVVVGLLFLRQSQAAPLVLGVLLRMLAFKLVHGWCHRNQWFPRPCWQILFRLRAHHWAHHRNEAGNFGITTRYWDQILGTRARDHESKKQTTCRISALGG